MRVVTHDRNFHADDVTAVAIMRQLAKLRGDSFTLVRSRDPKDIVPGDLVVDVGARLGVFDLEDGGQAHFFDHHQRGGAGVRPNGVPFAAVGLVWSTFGRELLQLTFPDCESTLVEEMWTLIDHGFIAPIDAVDCGFELATDWVCGTKPLSLSSVVSSFNPTWNEESDFNGAFSSAVDFATTALTNKVRHAYSLVQATFEVETALKNRTDPRILVLERYCPWQRTLFHRGDEDVLYIVYPHSGADSEKWNCQCALKEKGSLANRKPLPAEWGGLREDELRKLTGVQDALFCHTGLFIASAGSKGGALKLALLALEK